MALRCPLAKVLRKYTMLRPLCQACNQKPAAINYYRDGEPHYRVRCDSCTRKKRGLKRRQPRWESAGYRKKMVCDRCGFRAMYASQTVVYHVDGDLTNVAVKNLKTICKNCVEAVIKSDLPWRPGDLAPDV